MSIFKKVTSTVGVIAIAVSSVSASLTVQAASTFTPYADALATAGIIGKQTSEAGYRLGDSITRAEMAKIAVNIKGSATVACTGKVFADVTTTIGDLCGYVEAAADAGLVNKIASKFRPLDLVTRAEMVKMLLNAKGIAVSNEDQGFKDIGNIGDLAGYINAAAKAGIIKMATSFNPNNTATRGEGFKVASNSAGLTTSDVVGGGDDLDLGDLFGDNTGSTNTGTTSTGVTSTGVTSTGVTAAGNLEIALNPTSRANGSQIPKVGIVRFAVVDFTAGGSDISLNTVELNKSGLASIPSGTRVWFEKSGTRLSGKTSFTSENNAVLSFAPALVVKAGSTESLDLYVEITTDIGAGNDLQFTSGIIVSSAVTVNGSFTTPTLRTANYTVASSTFTAQTSGQTYNAGSNAVELGKFTIANTDTNSDTRDLKLQSIMLYQSGSADLTNLSDITLERNGVVVSSAAMISGKTLTLTVSDTIKDGASAIYIVKAKIINVDQTTDTYQLYLKNTSDVNLVETDSAFRSVLTSVTANAGLYSVSGGDVKFERDATSNLSQTVAPGTSDIVLLKGTITAKSAVTLEDVTINYTTSTSGSTSMNTVYLQIGSSTFTATPTDTSATAGTLTFLGSATVNGTADVRMYTKLKNGATGTIKVDSLSIGNFGTKEYVVNQNTVTSAIGSISAITITIGASSLNVTRTDGLGATTLASGTKGVAVYGARFSSTQGNPISLSNLSVTTTGTASGTSAASYTGGNVSLTLYVDGVAKSTKNVTTTTVNFDGFNSIVSTTTGADIVIKADFSDVLTVGTFGIASISYSAVDNITSVTVTPVSVTGALFTLATASGTLATTTGDELVNRAILESGKTNQKIVSFKVTATNDNIKLKDITLTGAKLTALTNVRLMNAAMVVIGTASSLTINGATFANLDTASNSAIAQDKSATFYVVADVNSSTDIAGVVANVTVANSNIVGSNGGVIVMGGNTVVGASHDVAQNTFNIAQTTPTSKALAVNALEFKVTASGKNQVSLTGVTITTSLGAYSASSATGVISIYTKDNQLVGQTVVGTATGTTSTVVALSNYNVVSAGTNTTYVVKVTGFTLNASTNEAWTVGLTTLSVDTGVLTLDAANYPKNLETLPLTSVK